MFRSLRMIFHPRFPVASSLCDQFSQLTANQIFATEKFDFCPFFLLLSCVLCSCLFFLT